MANQNTNEDSFGQRFLGTHRPPAKLQAKRMGKAAVDADRTLRAKQKLVDMTPAQKKAELKRLKAKKKKRDKLRLSDKPSLRNPP